MAVNNNPAEVFSRQNDQAKIHDLEQFTLWTSTPDRPGFRSRMTFGERNGAPRITVFPNTEEGPKVLFVGMAPTVFLEFLRRFEEIVKGPNGKKDKIENLDKDPNAERTADFDSVAKIVRNVLWFGKSEDGVCWIAVQQANTPNIRFTLLPSAWHHFHKPDGTRITPEEGSAGYTLSLIEGLRMAMAPYIARIRPPYDKDAAKANAPKPALAGGSMSSISDIDDIPY